MNPAAVKPKITSLSTFTAGPLLGREDAVYP